MKRHERIRLLKQVFKAVKADKIIAVYLMYFLLAAVLIWILEPGISGFGDSLWYCFATATTVGYGDFAAATVAGRIVTVILSLYSVAVVAIITAVITGFFMDVVKNNARDSAERFMDELERLPQLSHAELQDLSERVKKFRKKL